jgi:hypothetical protein
MTNNSLISVLLLLASASISSAGSTLIKHDWGQNPLSEGWLLIDESNGQHRFTHVPNDKGDMATWRIDTKTGGAAGAGAYQRDFQWHPRSWQLNIEMKAIDIDAPGGQAVRVITGEPVQVGESRLYGFLFSTADDGDPIVSLEGTSFSMELEGGAGAFHRYNLSVKGPGFRSSRFFIDGELVYEGYFGSPVDQQTKTRIEWGDLFLSSSVNGAAHWGLVRLRSTVPEPNAATLSLLAGGSLAAFCPFRRSRQ